MAKRVKQKKHENLTESNIKKVIQLLSAEKPITKKELVEHISEVIGIEYQTLAGLEKSPKSCLKALEDALVLNLKPEEWK